MTDEMITLPTAQLLPAWEQQLRCYTMDNFMHTKVTKLHIWLHLQN